jgi:undecaprenyl-diphosphatase
MDNFTLFDGNLLIGIQDLLNADWLTPIMKFITLFGESGIFWIVVCLALLLFKRTRRLGIICSVSLAFTFICCNLLIKPAVDRTRPWVMFTEVVRYLAPPGDASFPSGHSANSMGPAWAMFIASMPIRSKSYDEVPCLGWRGVGAGPKTVHRFGIAAVILSLLIGLSRLYLGMHYPSDVAVGLLLGMGCATVMFQTIRAYEINRGSLLGSGDIKKTKDK